MSLKNTPSPNDSTIHKTIAVTQPIPEAGLSMLRPYGQLRIGPANTIHTPESLCELVEGCDALVCFVGDSITEPVLQAASPTCKIVANYGVGTDNIDIETATRLGIRVTNTPEAPTAATADLTMAIMLSLVRDLRGAEALAQSQTWKGIAPMQIFGSDISGKTLGIVGAGGIGCAVAKRANGFDMKLLYVSRKENDTINALGGRRVEIATLFAESDIVTLHVALAPETRHLVNQSLLARMKPSAFLINTSRGAVVKESDLIDCLANRKIAGAALDVFEFEPNIPAELLQMPNVLCVPHIGSATMETREWMARMAAANVVASITNQPLPNPVN
ncbi:MAG: D-glycerate dehydrogenase [Phycisphaerae bacterium]